MHWSEFRSHAQRLIPLVHWPEGAPEGWVMPSESSMERAVEVALMRCVPSVPSATREVLRRVDLLLRGWMQRKNYPPGLRDDAVQQAGASLVAHRGSALYSGAGTLDNWLTVSAVRSALNLLRSEGRSLTTESLPCASEEKWQALVSSTPELKVLRQDTLTRFKAAFEGALAALSARDRGLMGLRYGQGTDVDALARMYQVHRVTMSHWLAAARDQLREAVFEALGEPGEEADLRQWLGSRPELSLSRLFGAAAASSQDSHGSTLERQPVLK